MNLFCKGVAQSRPKSTQVDLSRRKSTGFLFLADFVVFFGVCWLGSWGLIRGPGDSFATIAGFRLMGVRQAMGRGLWLGLEMLGRAMLRAWCWERLSGVPFTGSGRFGMKIEFSG